jgi:hypothetical protein
MSWLWAFSKNISSGAQYVTLRKYFSHPSLVMYSFATPPIKLKLGQQIGGGLLIANHMDQSLRWANQKHWTAVRSFLQVHTAAPRTSRGKLPNYDEPKPLSRVKPVHVRFSSSIFTVQDHILSTAGDALTHYQKKQNLTTCIITVVSWWVLVHCGPFPGQLSLWISQSRRATVNQHPPAHHPTLDVRYDSVLYEPQLS